MDRIDESDEILVKIECVPDGSDLMGFLGVSVKSFTFDLTASEPRLLKIGSVGIAWPVEVPATSTSVLSGVSDDGWLALFMLPQQQQYYFLAAVGSGKVHPLHFPIG